MRIRGTSRVSRPRSPSNKVQPNLLMLGNSACDILGLRFGPARNVWVLLEALGVFCVFLFSFPHSIDHPRHLNSGVPSPLPPLGVGSWWIVLLSDTQAWFSYAADAPATWPPVLLGMKWPATLVNPVFIAGMPAKLTQVQLGRHAGGRALRWLLLPAAHFSFVREVALYT